MPHSFKVGDHVEWDSEAGCVRATIKKKITSHHDAAKWKQFQRGYWAELRKKPETVELRRRTAKAGTITFVYAARDEAHNGAVAL